MKLKPDNCKSCGGESHVTYGETGIYKLEDAWPGAKIRVECENRFDQSKGENHRGKCPLNMRTHHCETEQEAIEAWNTRASPWILCSDRLPDDHHPAYLVVDRVGVWHKAYIDGHGSVGEFKPTHWIHSEGQKCELDYFTHWQSVELSE